jgi:hypothetical protein
LAERTGERPAEGTAIVMLTGGATRGGARPTTGVAACLTKPIQQTEHWSHPERAGLRVSGQRDARVDHWQLVGGGRRSLRILLAEDNAVNQRLAVRLLEKRGDTVRVPAPAGKPWRRSKKSHSTVLMDVQMPRWTVSRLPD